MAGKVAIVGGGIAGLVAAADLARGGAEVTLFEAAGEPGGRARTQAKDGYFLNQGPHALYRGKFLETLQRLGVEVKGAPASKVTNESRALFEGQLHVLPARAGQLGATKLFGVQDKLQFAKVYGRLQEGATAEGSYAQWLDAQKLRPRVRMAMEALARVSCYANAPELASAAATLGQMRLAGKGVLYIDGGWTALVEGLARVAVNAGAMIRMHGRVERVQAGKVVLADGSSFEADAVLLATPPAEAAALAPDVASLKEEAEAAVPVRANALDLALKALPQGAEGFVLGVDRPLYFSVHSKAARLAPEGGAVVHVAKYLPTHEQPGADAIEELEAFADIAMPGWRELEVRRQTLRGIPVVGAVVRHDRPRASVAVTDAPGLFVAGDWVGGEAMLSDAAAASGAEAANLILARLGVKAAA